MDITEISQSDIATTVEQELGTNKFEIISYNLRPVDEKIGLLGDHAFLNITVLSENKEKNLNFFVKSFPKLEAVSQFAHEAGSFQREEFIYGMISEFKEAGINIIEECTGHCYVSRPNKYVIMTNLTEEGYKMIDKMDYLNYDNILHVLHSLAKFHASSLIFEEKMSEIKQEKYRILDGNEEKLKETLYNDCEDFGNKDTVDATLKCILSEIKLFDSPEILVTGNSFIQTAELIYPKIYQLVKPSQKYRNVLCHGDLWATNMMFKQDENGKLIGCKFVDFQSVRYVPPAHDVLSVLYLTTSRDFRHNHMYEVIGIYYSYLEKLLKLSGYDISKIIPFPEFMESCEEQKLFAVLFAVGILPLVLSDRDSIENIFCDKELYQKVFRGDRSCLVLNNKHNEKFMNRLNESIEDLKEVCEKFKIIDINDVLT